MSRSNTRAMVESAVMIGLAVVLSMVKVYRAPQGGSVTAGSMIPILAIALRWGPGHGITTGLVYGLVKLMLGAYIVHPVQAVLDYPVAFAALGLAGFARKTPVVGVAIGMLGRMVAHIVSGVIFFASAAPKGTPVLSYSLAYNASYLIPELLISGLVLQLLASTRIFAKDNGAGQRF